MRKKFRIFSTLTAMVLVVIVMCVGIWAASQATITGSGSLTFTGGSDVKAKITISSDDAIIDGSKSKVFDFYGSESNSDNEQSFGFGNLSFSADKQSYAFTITIHNTFNDPNTDKLASSLEITGIASPFNVTVNPEDYTTDKEVASEDLIYTVTISYDGEYEETASATFSVSLNLSKVSPAE